MSAGSHPAPLDSEEPESREPETVEAHRREIEQAAGSRLRGQQLEGTHQLAIFHWHWRMARPGGFCWHWQGCHGGMRPAGRNAGRAWLAP